MAVNKSPSGFQSGFRALIPLLHEERYCLPGLNLTGNEIHLTVAELPFHNLGTQL